jgi:hypothetical protein
MSLVKRIVIGSRWEVSEYEYIYESIIGEVSNDDSEYDSIRPNGAVFAEINAKNMLSQRRRVGLMSQGYQYDHYV